MPTTALQLFTDGASSTVYAKVQPRGSVSLKTSNPIQLGPADNLTTLEVFAKGTALNQAVLLLRDSQGRRFTKQVCLIECH
jgi:hypothetical protein